MITISSPKSSLVAAPNIIIASGSHFCLMMSVASLTSSRPRSVPPVTFIKTPLAPSIVVSSSGDSIACLAAAMALSSPAAIPIPI